MFKQIKENLINLITSRQFVLMIAFLVMGVILIHRVFVLQIVRGEDYLEQFRLQIRKERSIPSTRGNIRDVNGNLLAYNELAYTVTIEDVYESGSNKNAEMNATIYKLIHIIEDNGDSIINDFNIILNDDGEYEYTVENRQLLRFLADVYGKATIDKLEYKEETATPDEVMNYLCGRSKYGIGEYANPDDKNSFVPGKGYTKEELLKMVTIRYAMSANSFQKYIPTTVATDVNEKTVAVVMENSTELAGVAIAEDTIRKYEKSVYFSHIIGYTGKISSEELAELNAQIESDSSLSDNDKYVMTDIVGKAGIEQVMELELQGKKGSEIVYVDKLGKAIQTSNLTLPTAGDDIYLTIDADLQEAVYNIIEQKLAGILVTKIRNIKQYNPSENASASDIVTPIDDVYFALLNNNVIDISHFEDERAKETEKAVYNTFVSEKEKIFATLREELLTTKTPYNKLSEEYQVYQSYITSMLASNNKGVLQKSKIDTEDETYIAWTKDETISLHEYLNYAISQNWIDVTNINLSSQYADSEEIYIRLVDYIIENLNHDSDFAKKIYKYMIRNNTLTGRQVCILLCEQNVIEVSLEEETRLYNAGISAYEFMLDRIENLDITPAQLALDPYSASVVITDVNTGEVRALVSYPSYDNNKLANSVDAEYYNQLQHDLSEPLWDYATQQKTAPGSTFKMVSSVAFINEDIADLRTTVNCTGTFDKLGDTIHRCWNHSGHGSLALTGAIENSCNYYYYENSYLMSMNNGVYDSDYGIEKLAKYADMFGLSEKSGIEIVESEPQVSDKYSVPSAIGQGTHNYTTVGLARYVTTVANSGTCFNLSLLEKKTDSAGNLLENYTPEIRNTIDLPVSVWNAMHLGMRRVVENKSYYDNLNVHVAGKTGTAQENKRRPNHALFVGYAPYENPEIAIATRIAYGYTSDYAAELSRDVFSYYYGENIDEVLTGTADRPEAVAGGVTD